MSEVDLVEEASRLADFLRKQCFHLQQAPLEQNPGCCAARRYAVTAIQLAEEVERLRGAATKIAIGDGAEIARLRAENEKLVEALDRWPIVVTGFTGIFACEKFSTFHEDVERVLGRPVWTHEFAAKEVEAEIKAAYKAEFMGLIARAALPQTDTQNPTETATQRERICGGGDESE